MGSTKAGARERFRKEGKRESRGNNTFPRQSSGALPKRERKIKLNIEIFPRNGEREKKGKRH